MAEKKVSLAERIKRLRSARKLTQSELAEKAGIAHRTLQDIEYSKNKNPSVETVIALSKVLNVSMDGLLGLSEKSGPMPNGLNQASEYLAAFAGAPAELQWLVMAILTKDPNLLLQTSKTFQRKATDFLEEIRTA